MSLRAAATRRRMAGAIAVVLSTGVCALASHALADGSTGTTTSAAFGNETWYQPDPSCQLPTGCLGVGTALPPVNPYGANTLHVSVSAGQRTGSIYLAVKAVSIPAGQVITKAAFTAPLDTANPGSAAPDTSTTQVCTAATAITTNEGEFDDPPADTTCAAYAPLTYTATPTPALTGDLVGVLNAHLGDLTAGKLDLAIIPYNASATATWHDVIDANGGTATTVPTLALTFGTSDAAAAPTTVDTAAATASATASAAPAATGKSVVPVKVPVASPAAPVAAAPAADSPVAAPAAPGSVAAAPVVGGAVSAAPAPQVASSAADTQAQAAATDTTPPVTVAAATKTVGFAYPGVLLLPLLLAAGGVGLARVMTRDVTPKATGR